MTLKSEYESLIDLATAKGIPHSEILTDIHDKIISEYQKYFPDQAKTVDVFVDEKTGRVKLLHDKDDITPDIFSPIAEKIAREVIIDKLGESNFSLEPKIDVFTEKRNTINKTNSISGLAKWLLGIIFWGYNFIYLAIIIFSGINFLTKAEFRKVILGQINKGQLFHTFFILMAMLIPLIAILTGIKLIRNKKSDKLGSLFFFFEVPLVALLLIISGSFSGQTPAIWFFSLMLLFSIPITLIQILGYSLKAVWVQYILLFFKEVIAISILYLTLLFSFISPLFIGLLAREIINFFSHNFYPSSYYSSFDPMSAIMALVLGSIFILISLALIATPYVLAIILTRMFIKTKNILQDLKGSSLVNRTCIIFALFWFIIFALCSYQPNVDQYLGKLESITSLPTFEEREIIAKELMPHQIQIKRVFDDLANVRQRYLMSKNDNYLKNGYSTILNFSDFSAEIVQQTFMSLAYPFVYQGNLDTNNKAYTGYQYLFGSTPYYNQPTNFKQVKLIGRTINATTDYNNLLATITVEEEYKNTTYQNQEVVYEFSLPPDSVITGLKLGPNLEFAGVIAPKNAAVQTYEAELRKRRDPALLEQSGPNQYRLRVFPIPPLNDTTTTMGKNQKVQFKFVTTLNGLGYPLPIYSLKQNLNEIDALKKYLINGTSASLDKSNNFLYNSTLEKSIKNICLEKNAISTRSQFGSINAFLIPNTLNLSAMNFNCDNNQQLNLAKSAKGMKIALLFDLSALEAGNNNQELTSKNIQETKAKQIIKENNLAENNTIDVYKFNDLLAKPIRINNLNQSQVLSFTDDLSNYFGSSDPEKAIFEISGSYDFAIVLTNGSKTNPFKQLNSLKKDFPVYIVHEEVIPPYTNKTTNELLQSGGLAFTDFKQALNFAILRKMNETKEAKELLSPGDIYSYYISTNNGLFDLQNIAPITLDSLDPALSLIAKAYIYEKIRRQSGDLNSQIDFLDQITGFAQKNLIITPYSSWIAVVNEQQKSLLESLSLNLDRYKEVVAPPPPSFRSVQNNGPIGEFSPLSGVTFKSSGGMLNSAPMAFGDSGGSFSGGSLGLGMSPLILINGLLLGGGMLVFILVKLKSRIKKNTP